jgi:hypothetical protein
MQRTFKFANMLNALAWTKREPRFQPVKGINEENDRLLEGKITSRPTLPHRQGGVSKVIYTLLLATFLASYALLLYAYVHTRSQVVAPTTTFVRGLEGESRTIAPPV